MFCYTNIETYRPDDFESLLNGSQQYAMLDNPVYRVCVEPSKNSGFVKVRCVDDPTVFSKSATPDAISEGSAEEQKEDVEEEKKEKDELQQQQLQQFGKTGSRAFPDEPMVRRSGAPLVPAFRPPNIEAIREADEEEDEEDRIPENFMAELERRVDPANYVRQSSLDRHLVSRQTSYEGPGGARQFGPSSREVGRQERLRVAGNSPAERRPSPVLPQLSRILPPSRTLAREEPEYIYNMPVPLPLEKPMEKRDSRESVISDVCFQHKEVQTVEDDDDDPYPIGADTERRCYLSSKRMMGFFGRQFHDIARKIGKGNLSSGARSFGPAVLCREELEGTYKELTWHFIPTVEVGLAVLQLQSLNLK